MATPSHIKDGHFGTSTKAGVTANGQLVTAPFAYDDVAFKKLDVADTAYNLFPPIDGKRFVVTGLYAKADKQVSSTTEATLLLFEADSATSAVVTKTLFSVSVLQYDQITIVPMNLLVTAGEFVNAKTTDDDVHLTLFGYYVPGT